MSDQDSQKICPTEVEVQQQAAKRADDGIVRFTSDGKSLRKTVGYLLKKVKSGEKVTLQGYGQAMSKVLTVAGIIRDRVGEVHQITAFVSYEQRNSGREGTGVQIVLSLSELDKEAVGYQKPEPKGFWSSTAPPRKQERRYSSKAPVGVQEKVAVVEQKAEKPARTPRQRREPAEKKQAEAPGVVEKASTEEKKGKRQRSRRRQSKAKTSTEKDTTFVQQVEAEAKKDAPAQPRSARKEVQKASKSMTKVEEVKEAVAAPPSAEKSSSVKRDAETAKTPTTTSGRRPIEQAQKHLLQSARPQQQEHARPWHEEDDEKQRFYGGFSTRYGGQHQRPDSGFYQNKRGGYYGGMRGGSGYKSGMRGGGPYGVGGYNHGGPVRPGYYAGVRDFGGVQGNGGQPMSTSYGGSGGYYQQQKRQLPPYSQRKHDDETI